MPITNYYLAQVKLLIVTSCFLFSAQLLFGQTDTTKTLTEVTVKGYYKQQPLLRSTSAVSILDSARIKQQQGISLVGLVNTVAGVRMEERSPGSYRLSLRGSLLRSPFGIRNIKIYFSDFPLSDAGGNSYLNLIDAAAITNLEIYKGPEANNFGANTGGAILLNSDIQPNNQVMLSMDGGSYGLFHQTASIHQNIGNYHFNIVQGYQRSDGYRTNSAFDRKYFQTSHLWNYNSKASAKALVFYSDLNYQTPGGLTLVQLQADPRASRPATPTLPSATTQQAAIYNKTLFAGLSHSYLIDENFKHVIALFGSYTDFRNPFITNYEKRWENNLGLRTFLEYSAGFEKIDLNIQAGVEAATAAATINNFNNDKGNPSALQAADNLKAKQTFAFLRATADINKKLLLELSSSLNFFNYDYERYFPISTPKKNKRFNTVLMPKIALSYLINSVFTLRASASKGYSPPTIAEVRASDNNINNSLQAENGWNYEVGFRAELVKKRLFVDASTFNFNLEDAIVRRLNANDTEFFINAGGTKQFGVELQVNYWILKQSNGFLNGLLLSNSFTYSHFKFENFINGGTNFSGNALTGVPRQNLVSSLSFNFRGGLYFYTQYNYVGSLPLNDANTAYAPRYHLADLKLGKDGFKLFKTRLGLSAGINNLFNQKYSLGNDLNAVGGRFYNPAALRNYYAGLNLII